MEDMMKKCVTQNIYLEGDRIYLRGIGLDDVNENYCRWLNDPEVNRYLESRFYPHTLDTLRNFVSSKIGDTDSPFFAIIVKDGDRHIGNIKIGPINYIHRFGDVGLLIGEKDCWNKGYGSEAIRLVVKYAFKILNLHKLTAGFYENNVQSIKAFQKAGFVQEGIRKSQYFVEGKYVDDVLLGVVNKS
jgi:[ribosomal protein S5]-alanine N-acetyltransferase